MVDQTQNIDGLSAEEKRALLEQLLSQQVAEPEAFPLSSAQKRLWFLDQWEPGSSGLNIPAALRLTGDLNVDALARSLNAVVSRHDALRTTFGQQDDLPVQIVQPELRLDLPFEDIRNLDDVDPEAYVYKKLNQEGRWHFDLSCGPLLRAALLQLHDTEHVLILTIHHIICDGWSMGLLIHEMLSFYSAYVTDQAPELPELPIQYVDYAVWQQDSLTADDLAQQLDYWKRQLASPLPVLELPLDKSRPPEQTHNGDFEKLFLSQEISDGLRGLCRKERATLFMAILAAFKTLLYRYSGQSDIIVGAPIAGRTSVELEHLIGLFLNTLVLRTTLSETDSYLEVLRNVRRTTLDAYSNQDVPFETLLETLNPQRDFSRTPFFQVFFNMLNTPTHSDELPGLSVENVLLEEVGSKFDMTLYVAEEKDATISLTLVYNTDLFLRERMAHLLQQLISLISQAVAQPQLRIAQLSLIPEQAAKVLPDPRAPLSDAWQGGVHTLFEQQAAQHPQHLALVDDAGQWTYATLDQCVNQLAQHLVEQGVRPQEVVAIYAHRSASLVWAVLGALKAGAAFVILDPAYPDARLLDILQQAQPAALLALDAAGELPPGVRRFAESCRCFMRELNLSAPRWTGLSKPPAITVGPDDLACLAFTSGSTGKPKGIMGRHGSLSHFLPWQQAYFELGTADRYSMLSGLAHDPLQRDIFTALNLGGTLYIPDPEQIGVPGWLSRWMQTQEITFANLTPAMVQLLSQDAASVPSLRYALIVGEALIRRDVLRFQDVAPQVRCVNLYGATETQRAVGYYMIPRDADALLREVMPLGRGMPDAQLLVLNAELGLAGVGELGEIYVRSPHLSLGYLNQPQLTQERFVTNPFTQQPGDRLYRSGDLGRYLPDGNVEFCGRADDQVKVRGFRIELGEIAGTLGQHAAVEEAAVQLRTAPSGGPALVAYVVPAVGFSLDANELREHVRALLPDYMVPQAYVELDALPLTPNRKLDRRALPEPEWGREQLASEYVAARTATERTVAAIWAEVLGVERVGVHDNFFDLGGHSLIATQVISRLRDAFGAQVSLRALFESPTVAGLAEHVQLAQGQDSGPALPLLLPESQSGHYPLSFTQQRLWFLEQLEPDNTAYRLNTILRLRGDLKMAALEKSVALILERHTALRARVRVLNGEPYQEIASLSVVSIPIIDLSGVAESKREARMQQCVLEETKRPFDLAHDNLLRVKLLRLALQEHILLLNVHHIAADGWSFGLLFRELQALYSSYSRDESLALPELTLRYVDFVQWQRDWLQGEVLEQQLDFWMQQLAGANTTLDLPTDHPRPPAQTFNGANKPFEVSAELTAALKKLGREEGATLSMSLLAAFNVLLHRYSGQDDILVGTPIASRRWPEVENVVGYFANTLVLRTDLSAKPDFRTLLRQVRGRMLDVDAHQDLPFETLVDALHLDRDMSRSPLFQVMFILQNTPVTYLEFADLEASHVSSGRETAKFDLTLSFWETEQGLRGNFEYNTDLFEDATLERMVAHFKRLLASCVDHPQQPVATLDLLDERDRETMLYAWNATQVAPPAIETIHELVAAQVAQTPDAVAVTCGQQSLTYGELNARAELLAHTLRQAGVVSGDLVALALDRSLEMLVGMLGILKTGAAYLPLDPDYPLQRLALMVEDSQTQVLVTHSALLESLPLEGVRVICVDRDLATQLPAEPTPLHPVGGDDLAYVIYTSGSTGKPKGVQIRHRALVNFLNAMRERPGLTAQDVLLAVTTLSFDIAELELWLPLIVGARVLLASREAAVDSAQLQALLAQGVTVMQATPATWQMLLSAGWEGDANLKILCGGEMMTPALAAALYPRCAELWNMYGPTETTVWSSVFKVSADLLANERPIPIGRPIDNTEFYILDEAFEPLPVGVPGALYIGGTGLARGYLGRADLTVERFMPHPFSKRAGARIYQSGDLARYLPDGNVEFLGRMDDQVKVRGYRIELGEIEAALAKHPDVAQSVVVARELQPGDKRLVAYVIPREDVELPLSAIRAFLAQTLPDYMLPSALVALAEFPLTANRKVNRRALPAPDLSQMASAAEYVAPSDDFEEILVEIWEEVLGRERVGVHDNFFDLGGHSLLATQVIARIQTDFGVALPLRELFETPTVAGLATALDALDCSSEAPQFELRRSLGAQQEGARLSFAQRRLWFLDQWEEGAAGLNIPAVRRLKGDLDVDALKRSLNQVVERHAVLRTTFGMRGDEPVQIVAPHLEVDIPLVDLSDLAPDEREAAVLERVNSEGQWRFDLSRGPLLRALLLRLADREHVLLLNLHHIISDAWSIGILIHELTEFYTAAVLDREPQLPVLEIQYADYANWQHKVLQSGALVPQLEYWKTQLGGTLPSLDFPLDKPRPAVRTSHGKFVTAFLPAGVTEGVRRVSRRTGSSFFMVLLATFKTMLSRYTGQSDIIVGSPIAGRTRQEVENLIGFFLNTLVLRTDLSGDLTFEQVLKRVRDVTLDAYANQDVPFEMLLEELRPERDLSRTPLFQVFFNMINVPRHELNLPNLEMEFMHGDEVSAKFDMTLYLVEAEDYVYLQLLYNPDLFTQARMEAFLAQFQHLLEQVVVQPQQRIAQLSLIPEHAAKLLPDPRAPLSDAWQGGVHSLFEQQAAQHPQHLAVVDSEGQWTYAALEQRANQLAQHLLEQGVQSQEVVAIYAHRSASLVWAVLGTLKAGAAFLILDPAYPGERLLEILQQAQPAALLALDAAGELTPGVRRFAESCRCFMPGLSLPNPRWLSLSKPSLSKPSSTVGPDDLACLAFTSGSTGKPKGIMGRHGSLSHFLPWQQAHFELGTADRYSMLSGLAHDPLQRDIFTALALGGTLCIPDPEQIGVPGWLSRWMQAQEITVAHLTPAMVQLLSQDAAPVPSLRYALIVGEALIRHDVLRFHTVAPQVRCVNLYGATETQRAVGYYMIPRDADALLREVMPLGQGMPDAQLLVLNAALGLAGVGELGEIYVRSPHLSLGYLNQPQLTQERFVTNPFTQEPGDRLYRSGDLGRYLPDGNVEFCGRADDQVKVRGFRIELGEISGTLGRHVSVEEAAVQLRTAPSGGPALVAYVVLASGCALDANELREHVRALLPDYMVPQAYVELDALPLTPNRKLDRRALPEPEWGREQVASEYVEARTATERTVAEIWVEVLGVERVGVHDNFFDLGGHSLIATQVISRLRDAFGAQVSLRALFESPTVAGLAAHVQLAPEQGARPELPVLQAESQSGRYPLSFTQQRLWFLEQLEPDNTSYRLTTSLRLRGDLNVTVLEKSVALILERHTALRARVGVINGEPYQEIADSAAVTIPFIDLSGVEESKREAQMQQCVIEETKRPFDLAHDDLLRVKLLRLAPQEHILLINVHHIAADGWSFGVLTKELKLLYSSYCEGKPVVLPALKLRYVDFVQWQRDWLQGEVVEQQLDFWKQQLEGANTTLDLPTDHPRPPAQTFNGANKDFEVSAELTAALKKLGREEGATLFMLLLTAFNVLLHRYSGQEDILVGTPIANRRWPEVENLVGYFANTLVLRTDLSAKPNFRTLLRQVRERMLDVDAHQDLPFETLVDALHLERDMSRSPLFQVMFILQNTPASGLEFSGLESAHLSSGRETAKFDLTLSFWETERGLYGNFEYNTDLFEAPTLDRMVAHFKRLLASCVEQPQQPVATLELLDERDRETMLYAWNATQVAPPAIETIHELVAAQVAQTPDAVAVTCGQQSLTYGELNARAELLAHTLRQAGVVPGNLVALALERSPEMLVGMLGILKAGAAYLPLDPDYPLQRLALMVADSQTRVLVTHSALLEALPLEGVRAICVDRDLATQLPAGPQAMPEVAGDDLAYVIYTSGSTGKPKGVQIRHRAVVNFLNAMRERPGLTAQDVLLAVTTLSFDIAEMELWLPLIVGARVLLASREAAIDSVQLQALLAQGVTVMQATPATWQMLLSAGWEGDPNLKILCGGEMMTPALAAALYPRCAELWNMYGPTETTVWSSVFKVSADLLANERPIPIGRPIDNTEFYILDEAFEPVPVGVPGALYIGGEGLARGYLGRADLTVERFAPHPFSERAGARIYQTGDLARYLPDGNVEFLGRMDDQVKVRGYRIELGEIEAALAKHADVAQSVVVARELQPGDKRLVAYVIPRVEVELPLSVIREFLSETLPDYMLPAAVVALEEFPLTANRKVNRRALPSPDLSQATSAVEYAPPSNDFEEILVGIWEEVLGRERVGIHDNFFDLGGHSLLATQIVSRVREGFELEMPVRTLFEAPTVGEMAARVEGLFMSMLDALDDDEVADLLAD